MAPAPAVAAAAAVTRVLEEGDSLGMMYETLARCVVSCVGLSMYEKAVLYHKPHRSPPGTRTQGPQGQPPPLLPTPARARHAQGERTATSYSRVIVRAIDDSPLGHLP